MITESFLDSAFTIALNKTIKVRKNVVLFRDILEILKFYKKQESDEIPISFRSKFEFLKNFCEMKIKNGKTDSNILDSLLFSDKYKDLSFYITYKMEEKVSQEDFDSNVRQLRLRKKLNGLLNNYKNVESFLETIRDGTYESLDEVIGDYESIVKTMYTNLMEHNRIVEVEASSSLDLTKDSYENLFETIIGKYAEKNIIPTGIRVFDEEVFENHGLEATRLYIFGGGSGSGKSTIINNIIASSATSSIQTFNDDENNDSEKDKKKVYLYITLENQIDEGFLRTYQPLFDKTTRETLHEIKNGVNIQERLKNKLNESGSKIIMKYFPAMSISPIDISMIIDEVEEEYGKGSIALVAIDYLDLLRTDIKFNEYRFELGYIALSLKTMAVQYNVPVVTATQLNREIYRVQNSEGLNLAQIGESAKKIDHADFIALLVKDSVDDSVVHCKIGKNRSGKGGVEVEFKVDFSKYRFISGSLVRSNISREREPLTRNSNFGGTQLLDDENRFDGHKSLRSKRSSRSDLFS